MTPGIFCDIGWFAGPIVSAKITYATMIWSKGMVGGYYISIISKNN